MSLPLLDSWSTLIGLALVSRGIHRWWRQPRDEVDDRTPADGNQLIVLFRTQEGRILALGVGMALVYLLSIGVWTLRDTEGGQLLLAITATNIIFGRAAGMSLGYAGGLGNSVVVPVNMIIETILVIIFYPLFVFSWKHLVEIKYLKKLMKKTRHAAETHMDKIQKFGIVGLFVFVWFPFWMTGPVVGCVIGYLIGIRAWINFTVVLSGTYVAILVWGIFLERLTRWAKSLGNLSPFVIFALIVAFIIAGKWWFERSRKTNLAADPVDRDSLDQLGKRNG